ncbi:hypothetical protein FB446DRAFT_846451 [Lentinula raphanica]|nr:hypothetical protein FB446DRAFT_846451 [Lentinula raphanica]
MYILVTISVFMAVQSALGQLSELPTCADECVQNALLALDCPPKEVSCLCTATSILPVVSQCSASSCSAADQATVVDDLDAVCDVRIATSSILEEASLAIPESGLNLTVTPGLPSVLPQPLTVVPLTSGSLRASASDVPRSGASIVNATVTVTNAAITTSTTLNVTAPNSKSSVGTSGTASISNGAGKSVPVADRDGSILGLLQMVVGGAALMVWMDG